MEFILLILVVLVFLGLPLLQMRKQSRQIGEIRSFQSSLTPGMVVQLTSGLHGRIVSVGETTVDIEVSPGIVTTWERAAVLKLVDAVDPGTAEADHLTGAADFDGGVGRVPDDLSSLDTGTATGAAGSGTGDRGDSADSDRGTGNTDGTDGSHGGGTGGNDGDDEDNDNRR
ncbi:hypothetical protein Csp1_13110 [Corynebacterium provencense]|jgi:preprotein translocase subunit YajC|uniref:Sec translocon accessory complex subunit YajC n=1 Tax=Corynebacterium provencense TaxID=1737425 RepID=A0A2Z3YU32_9CORY|nr:MULTISPECIES: preprotein translocase subunit YajC [Corynebacterium]AWT26104.1 hypothetical protein Csp1_13110 [Corynebacterium provencense]MCI1256870.1 preprotein translocase subunit YajC [Corynebacterium provencense]